MAFLDVSTLPIAQYRNIIIDTVKKNQVTIVFGDTGSGKTTQIPQYLFQAGLHDDRVIAITQPRRIAAISMAKRVADEMSCGLGIEVGYEVRFESRFSGSTKIKYMTDGTLLNYCLSDPRLSEYGIIMIDEAHERSIHTDVLLGLLKRIRGKRKDLRILITSATITTEKFSEYFDGAPVIAFEGRLFPVQVEYMEESDSFVKDAVELVKKIHTGKDQGDILVFLTGHDEIETCCESLRGMRNLVVFPLHGSMDCDTQQMVFKYVGKDQRKLVVATNIAETTITIDGIKFVIDCGYVKENYFNVHLGMEVLEQKLISRVQAEQRKGRAGRTCEGRCFRLYNESRYDFMDEELVPEIKRKNLCEIYLKIVAMDLDPLDLEFIDQPDRNSLTIAGEELQQLDLLDASMRLTKMGRAMSDLPVSPILGKVLMSSSEFHCIEYIVTILSMMTETSIFKRSKKPNILNNIKEQFYDPYGDHLTLLNIFREFTNAGKSRDWCNERCLNYDKLIRVDQAHDQLLGILRDKNIRLDALPDKENKDQIRNAIIKGFYRNLCVLDDQEPIGWTNGKSNVSKHSNNKVPHYIRYMDSKKLFIDRQSCLFKEKPKLILYHDIIYKDKPYMYGIMRLEESVLADFPEEMKKITFAPGTIPQRMRYSNCVKK